jgi:hypothetical protein
LSSSRIVAQEGEHDLWRLAGSVADKVNSVHAAFAEQ